MLLCPSSLSASFGASLTPRPVCPLCSNLLRVSQTPVGAVLPASPEIDRNRFECRTCTYQRVIDRRYFERTPMKRKEVDDVVGGADRWDNADKTEGEWQMLGLAWCEEGADGGGYS